MAERDFSLAAQGLPDDGLRLAASADPFLCPLSDGWVLYYPSTDRLLILNGTAKTVWDLRRQGLEEFEIASAFARHFGISAEQAGTDVAQALAQLSDDGQSSEPGGELLLAWAAANSPQARATDPDRPTDCGIFRFGRRRVRVLSSVPAAGESLFERFQHRRSSDPEDVEVLEIAARASGYRLTLGGQLIAAPATILQLLSRLVELLLSLEHPQRPLLASCHAAVVSRGGRSVLMPGSSGVGKSTLTAFLVANGFAYVGDDTIAIGEADLSLLPLPTCLSIKSGSWTLLTPVYPALADLPALNRCGRTLRYLAPRDNYQAIEAAVAPTAIVFPAYAAGEPARLRPLTPIETMIRLVGAHARLLQPASEARLARLVGFVEKTPAYELAYCELSGALTFIEDLLAS